ncbi:uncharacterized protein LOC142710170 [Rhinoderma darwinii]|uniref:uncharacterized protein LOC142710170 n=1 Tax=Rhinoderma darwinii TaxID=43563 RepID=UPI003F6649AA
MAGFEETMTSVVMWMTRSWDPINSLSLLLIRMDMADAVTYADLRFAEIPRREKKPSETSPERDSDHLDFTYENVVKPPGERKVLEATPSGRWHPLLAGRSNNGFRHWAPHLALLFLLLCLILSAITIERTMKYLHVSSELETLATNHQTMNNSLMKNLESKGHVLTTLRRDLQNAEQRVKQLTESTEELASSLQKTKDELQTQKTMEINGRMALERAEKTLSEEQSKLNQWEKDRCPENWILVGRKCLLLMDEEGSWTQCDNSCKSEDANLIVVQWNDQKLQAFLSNKTGDSWVGKELRYKENGQSWEWPDRYSLSFTVDTFLRQPFRIGHHVICLHLLHLVGTQLFLNPEASGYLQRPQEDLVIVDLSSKERREGGERKEEEQRGRGEKRGNKQKDDREEKGRQKKKG